MKRFFFFILFLKLIIPRTVISGQSLIDVRIDELLDRMTIKEKIAQLHMYAGINNATGPINESNASNILSENIKQGLVGAMINEQNADSIRKYQKLAVDSSRLGIPIIFGLDVIHGFKTIFPIPLGEAASWDLKAIERSARISAIEASSEGVNWTFAPMMDISRDPRWGRVMEGAGEDPYLNAQVAVARIKGFQGNCLADNNTIAACAKHFAGYGFIEGGRDYNSVIVDNSTLYNTVLPPFKAALKIADVKTFMSSFNILDGIPATANIKLLRDILKRDWNFNGFVVSDWNSIAETIDHGLAENLKDAAGLAINAGTDMDMGSNAYISFLSQLVQCGIVKEEVIDESVRRILKVKFELGLFDDPYKYCSSQKKDNKKEHLDVALDVAKRSIVLLKNDNHLLPLKKGQKNIAVIGDLADDKMSMLGNWIVSAEPNSGVSVLEGIQKYVTDFKYEQGVRLLNEAPTFSSELNVNMVDRSGMDEAVQLAKKSEVVILVLGEHGFHSGEARVRSDLGLPGLQQELLEKVFAVNKNIVLIMPSGRPLTISWAAQHIPAILAVWQLGTRAGDAIASVLFGDYNPSGKLPMTFPKSVSHIPVFYNCFNSGRPYKDNNNVFYPHYMDDEHTPLYPFGFGLSYSTFKYSDLKVSVDLKRKCIDVTVNVKNISEVDGEEVIQLYVHDKVASIVRPIKELKSFKKELIKSGESKNIHFKLDINDLGFYDSNGIYKVEPGYFDIFVGGNSIDLLKKTINI